MRPIDRALVIASLAALLAACGAETAAPSARQAPVRPPAAIAKDAARTAKRPDPRADAYALLEDLRAAHAVDRDERAAAFDHVRARWRGRAVRWEVGTLAALCPTATACHALPFDRARAPGPIDQGWLPALELAPEEHARLRAECADAPLCVVTIDATMKDVRLSEELPTRVTLADVRLVSARPARASESWARSIAPSAARVTPAE